jgi:hypothetical protein
MRSFTISTDRIGPRRWCWVRVHDNVDQLRDAQHRLTPSGPRGEMDSFGCFQSVPYRISYLTNPDGDGRWPANGYAGTIRLAEGWVTSEVVPHELVHAAAQIYRMNVARVVNLGEDCGDREEDLAYIYGELFADLQDKLEGAIS